MGRLNVGGGGKRVEIKFMGYAKSGTSPLGVNVADRSFYPIVGDPKPQGIIDGHVYVLGDGSTFYKVKINSDNSLTKVSQIDLRHTTPYSSGDIALKSITIYGGHIHVLVEYTKVSPRKYFIVKLDKDLNVLESDRELIATGLPSSIGNLFIVDGQIITTHVSTQKALDIYLFSDTSPHTLVQKKTIAPPYNSNYVTTANQSRRISDSLFATLRDVNDWVVYDKTGKYMGTIGPVGEFPFSDGAIVYDTGGNIHSAAYSIFPDTNSISDPKRKNLSAKFDILPDFLGGN